MTPDQDAANMAAGFGAALEITERIVDEMAPKCGTCGVEITTGLMAVFCPRREGCEFWPKDAEGQAFIKELRGES